MSVVKGRSKFVDYKKKTKPLFALPRSVQETVPISKIYEDGIFEVEDITNAAHVFDKAYRLSDINYTLKNDEEKEKVLLLYFKILNSFECGFKLVITNTKRDLKKLQEQIAFEEREEILLGMGKAHNDWILEKLKAGHPEIVQNKYLVITANKKNYAQAKLYFQALEGVLMPLFESIKGGIRPLSTIERLSLLKKLYKWEEEGEIAKDTLFYRDVKNDIVPAGMKEEKDILTLGKVYTTTLFSAEFPNKVDEGKVISKLSNLAYPSIITMDFAPVPNETIKKKLFNSNRSNECSIELERERKSKQKNYLAEVSYKKQKKKDELEEYMQQLEDDDESGFFFSILITLAADMKEELETRIQEIVSTGRGMGIGFEPYLYRQRKAFTTALPLGAREVNAMRCMLTSSTVAFHPFYTKDIFQGGGQFLGINRTSKNPIVLNRKRLKNGNGIVAGHSGSGKSFYLKSVEVSQVLLGSEDDVFIIDPQNEFAYLTQLYGGQFFDLSAKSGIHLNLLEIPKSLFTEEGIEREKFVAGKVSFLLAFLKSIMTNLTVTGIHESIITDCVMDLYEDFFQKKKSPLLLDLYKKLVAYGEKNERDSRECREIYKPLEVYTTGVFDMFSKASNIDIQNRFVVFGIKHLTEQIWEPVMLVIMHLLSQRMNYNQSARRATRFIVDEGQVVCTRESSAIQLTNAFLTYRKFGGICTLAVQNMSIAIANKTIASLVDNCEFKICFDQGGIDRNEIINIMDLSSHEADALSEEVPGYSLICWGKNVVLCDGTIEKENPMFDVFSTNFHDE